MDNDTKMTISSSHSDTEVETTVGEFSELADNMERLNNLRPGDTISTTGKQFMEVDELKELATEVIEDREIELGPAAVCYFLTYPNISKKRAAKTTKCNRKLKHFSGYDYIIEFSGELWDMLDDAPKPMLMEDTGAPSACG